MTTTAAPTPPRWNVFLSSTVRDLEDYRRGIKQALDRAQVECYPSEDWVSAFAGTRERCRQMFDAANSYLLLLGYWAGSELPASGRSVTHEEFRWACERPWPMQPPPLGVLMPCEGSAAEARLRADAQALRKALKNKQARARHDQLLQAWHDDALGSWQTVTRFRDLEDLCQRVLVLLREWDRGALLALARQPLAATAVTAAHAAPAAAAATDGAPRLTELQIGLLCRTAQFSAIGHACDALAADPADPAVALLVHGARGSGESPFLHRLVQHELHGSSRCRGAVPQPCDPSLLLRSIAQLLGLDAGPQPTPQRLAAEVARALMQRPLCFVLERCARYPGGVQAVEAEVWAPFFAALQALHAAQRLPHPLVAVLADFSGKPSPAATAALPGRARLLPMPTLGPSTLPV